MAGVRALMRLDPTTGYRLSNTSYMRSHSQGRGNRPNCRSGADEYELVINLKTAKALGLDSASRRCSPAPTR